MYVFMCIYFVNIKFFRAERPRKGLTTPALHYEFIKGMYIRMAMRKHGYPPHHEAGAKGLYRTGWDG